MLKKLPFRIVIRRYEAIIGVCLVLVSGVVIPARWEPPVEFYEPPRLTLPRRLPRLSVLPVPRPQLAFTFDDGPHPAMTQKLLEVLNREQVPATFFVVGKMAERHPHIVKEILKGGHEIANHTYTHPRLTRVPNDQVLLELGQTRDAIERLTGKSTWLYRPPGGDFSERTVRVARRAGYRMVLWSIQTKDVQGAPVDDMRRRIIEEASDGGVVLMHSGVKNTIEVLPGAIAQLREQGYEFVTVSALLQRPDRDRLLPDRDPAIRTARLPNKSKPALR